METNFNGIDHLFKEELGGYTEAPPSAVWDALEKRLKSEDKRRVFPFRWFWHVGIAAFIVLIGSSIVWNMLRDADSNAELTSATGEAISTPKYTAAAADNTPSTNVDYNNKPAAFTHPVNTNVASNIIGKNSQEEKNAATRRNRSNITQYTKQVQKQNVSKEPNSDLYADTEDDAYVVGGKPNGRSTHADGHPYVTDVRTQHNIRVAETDPAQNANEYNYGSYAALTRTNARAVSNARYDVDMSSDDATTGYPNAKNQRSKYRNKPAQEQLYASTAKRVTTHKRAIYNHVPSSAFAEEPSKITKTKEKRPISHTKAPGGNEIKLAKNTGTQKTNWSIAAHTKIPYVASKKNAEAAATPTKQHKEGTKNNVPQTSGTSIVATSTDESKSKKGAPAVASNTPSIRDDKKQTTSGPSLALAASAPAGQPTNKIAEEKKTDPKKKEAVLAISTPSVASTDDAPNPTTGKTKNVSVTENKTKPVIAAIPAIQTATTKPASSPKRRTGKTERVKGGDVTPNTLAVAAAPRGTQKHVPKKTKTHADVAGGVAVNTSTPLAKSSTPPGPKTTKHHTAQPVNIYVADKPETEADSKNTQPKKSVAKGYMQPAADVQKTVATTTPRVKVPQPLENTGTDEIVATKAKKNAKPIASKSSTEATKIDDANKATIEKAIAETEYTEPKKGNPKNGRKSKNESAAQPAAQPNAYMYSNSLLNRLPEDETVLADNLKVASFTNKEPIAGTGGEEIIHGTFKNDTGANKENSATAGKSADNTDSTTKHHLFSTKFEAGVKAGYETAFNGHGANKLVVSPYLQYNFSDKFSILAQPSVKMSHVSNHHVGHDTNYNDRSNTVFTQTDSGALYIVVFPGGNAVTIRNTLTKYTATYDSIVKSYGTQKNYMEVELPLMLKYKIGKGLSVYGGANGIYSKYTSIKEQTNYYTGTAHTVTISPPGTQTKPNASNLNLPGTPIANYNGPLYPERQGSLLRLGYMLGFSYEYKKRWLFDVLMHQAMVQPHYEAGYDTNLPLSLPYFRFTLGYKLTK